MRSPTAPQPAPPPMPVQRSATECTPCIFPHLAMPTRAPQDTRGSHRLEAQGLQDGFGAHKILAQPPWGM